MISHLLISIKGVKLNTFIRVFIETGLFIILHSHWWVHIGNIYLGSFEIALIIYISLTSWLSPHSSLLAPLFFIVTHLLLCEWSFLHFVTFILGSLIFERMLDLWVYTYKPWGFIYSSLSDSYFPKIMYYKTYVSCIYTKILIFDLSRWHYSWIFYSRMTYVSIRRFGHGTQILNHLDIIYIFHSFYI